MNNKYLVMPLIFAGLMLGACGPDNASKPDLPQTPEEPEVPEEQDKPQDEAESAKAYTLDYEESLLAAESSETKDPGELIITGNPAGAVGTLVKFKINLNKGFSIYRLKFNGEKIDVNTREVTPVEGTNIISVTYIEDGYDPLVTETIDFSLSNEFIEQTTKDAFTEDEFKAKYFTFEMLDDKEDSFKAVGVFKVINSKKDNFAHYVRLGSSALNGQIEFAINQVYFDSIVNIEIEALPYYQTWIQNGETKMNLDRSALSIDGGKTFKDIVSTAANPADIKPVKLIYTKEDCEKLNNVVSIITGQAKEQPTERNRVYIKSLKITVTH